MIKVKDLTVKNFMSVGNQTQAVDFDKEQLIKHFLSIEFNRSP